MGKVTVYTSFSFMLDTFDLSFRAMYPDDHLHLVTFRDHPKKVFERIKEEVESGESSADIVIGPHWMILNLQRSGLLKPYDSPEFAEYKQEFYDAKGAWCAMALSPVGLAYNINHVSDDEAPTTLFGAVDEKWKGKLAFHEIVDNNEGQMGLTYLTVLQRVLGQKKWDDLVGRLAELSPKTYECMPDMALNIGLGKSYLGLPATMSCIAYYFDIQNRPIKHRMPTDIPYLTTFAPSLGFLGRGEDPDWAERAFDFALSEDWQSRVESFGGKIPARNGLAADWSPREDVEYFPTLNDASRISEYREILRHKLSR
jgi:ABC-type Fe3+ transport system substrate-binding protein